MVNLYPIFVHLLSVEIDIITSGYKRYSNVNRLARLPLTAFPHFQGSDFFPIPKDYNWVLVKKQLITV